MESLSKEFVDCFVAAITARPDDFNFHTRIKEDRFEQLLCDSRTGYKINVEHVYLIEPFALTFEEDDKQRMVEVIEGFKQGHVRGMFNRALMEPREYAEPTENTAVQDQVYHVGLGIREREAAQLAERQKNTMKHRFGHISVSDNTNGSFP